MATVQTDVFSFELGDGVNAFILIKKLWPHEKFGNFTSSPNNVKLISDALRDRQIILIKKKKGKQYVGFTLFDATRLFKTLHIPFIILEDSLTKGERAKAMSETILLIARFVERSNINKILIYKDFDNKSNEIEKEINEELKAGKIGAEINFGAKMQDYFGDGRAILPVNIFIDPDQRPNLTARLARRSPVGTFRGMVAFTSGCKEDSKDGGEKKDLGKEQGGKDGKDDGKEVGIDFRSVSVRPGVEYNDAGLLLVYKNIGIETWSNEENETISFI